jgi:hypothetical protein
MTKIRGKWRKARRTPAFELHVAALQEMVVRSGATILPR